MYQGSNENSGLQDYLPPPCVALLQGSLLQEHPALAHDCVYDLVDGLLSKVLLRVEIAPDNDGYTMLMCIVLEQKIVKEHVV